MLGLYRHTTQNVVFFSIFIETELFIEIAEFWFAALGSEHRLLVLKVLVRGGHLELSLGLLGKRASVTVSTLTHHMKILTQSGLVEQRKEGRNIICATIAFDKVQDLSRFLLNECCADITTPCDEQSNG